MICPKCKHDIPVSSDYCPECGAPQTQKDKQKRGIGKKVAAVIICCFVASGVLSIFFGGNDEKEETAVASTAAAETVVQSTPQPVILQDPTPEPTASPLDDNIIDIEISDCQVTYAGYEIVQNMADVWCIAVYYTFTNNSSVNRTFSYTVMDKAFQGGIELETSRFYVNDDSRTSDVEIQPGASATVCSGYVLRDTSDVELQIYPFISISDTPKDAMILSLESDG